MNDMDPAQVKAWAEGVIRGMRACMDQVEAKFASGELAVCGAEPVGWRCEWSQSKTEMTADPAVAAVWSQFADAVVTPVYAAFVPRVPDDALPTIDDLHAENIGITGGKDPGEYIRELRGG